MEAEGDGRDEGKATAAQNSMGGKETCARVRARGSRREEDEKVRISKRMSAILRHNVEKNGLSGCLRPDGYVPLARLLKVGGFEGVTEAKIDEVVRECTKQRFSIIEEDGVKYIRANQGHSISSGLDDEAMLERLDPQSVPIAIHGTDRAAWHKIVESGGLSRMGRRHIHLATGLPGDDGVISGMRRSSQVHVFVSVVQAAEAGVVFYRSENGVILTAGVGDSGVLPLRFIARAVDSITKLELPLAHVPAP